MGLIIHSEPITSVSLLPVQAKLAASVETTLSTASVMSNTVEDMQYSKAFGLTVPYAFSIRWSID